MPEQLTLFGEGPQRIAAPEHDHRYPGVVRLQLQFLLEKLRSAERLPMDAYEEARVRRNVPVMVRWLPPEEGARLHAEFDAQMARLAA